MKKGLILLVLTVFCLADTWANPRSYAEILALAKQHFALNSGITTRSADFSPEVIPASTILKTTKAGGSAGAEAFYVFSLSETGYVIVSGDDQMKPVLGYSAAGAFRTQDMPENMRAWLQFYAKEFEYSKTLSGQSQVTYISTRSSEVYPETIAPLLGDIKWNQDEPFNDKCPKVNGVTTYTGCVATAMAQVMKYHNYPAKGKSSYSYVSETNKLSSTVDFSTKTFLWDQMLPSYQSGYSKANADAVADLMFCCGVSVSMDYGTDASGAADLFVPDAMSDYFGYDSNIRYYMRDYVKPSEWINTLKKELSEQRPVIYGGLDESEVGHEFVVDGYDKGGLFHINWGWSGANNGYFEITALNPAAPGIGGGNGGYNVWQSMITGIQKPTSTTSYVSSFLMPSSITVDKKTLMGKTSFKLTVPAIYNYGGTFSGKLQAVLYQNGKFVRTLGGEIKIDGEVKRGYGWGNNRVVFDKLTIPSDVANGDYELYVGTKDNRETNWSLAQGALTNVDHFLVNVNGTTVKLTEPTVHSDLSALTLKEEHALYSTKTKSFTMSVMNKGDECNLVFGVALQPVGQENAPAQVIAYARNFILNGEEKSIYLAGADTVAAGNYYMLPVYTLNGADWGVIRMADYPTITVHPDPTTPENITLTQKVKLESDVIRVNEPLAMTLVLKNAGGAYDGMIGAAIFEKDGSDYSVDLFYKNVFLDAGKEQTVELSGIPNVKEGTYIVSLRYYTKKNSFGNGILPRSSSEFEFTVKGISTANEDIQVSEGISVYPSPAVTQLNITAHEKLNRIEIVNLSGGMVEQVVYTVDTGSTCSLQVSGLTPGVYFVRAYGDQKIYTQKFIKK